MSSQYGNFLIPGEIELIDGKGALPTFLVKNEFAEAEICFHGAHVLRFDPRGEKPLLWVSPTSPFSEGKAIRGGVPICFPWFGPHKMNPDFPMHGFVRTRLWEPVSVAKLSDGRTRIVMAIVSDDRTRSFWPHEFRLELAITVGSALELALTAINTGREPFSYEDCLHTYFLVGDIHQASISGFDGTAFIDRAHGDVRAVQSGKLGFSSETVNAFMRAPKSVTIEDPVLSRRIVHEKEGFDGTVVWTPWEVSAAKNPEIGLAWKNYVCVEAADCLDSVITLLPGNSHTGFVRYRIES